MVAGSKTLVGLICASSDPHQHHFDVRLALHLVLGVIIILPTVMGDNGISLERDSFTSQKKYRNIPVHPVQRIQSRTEAEIFLRHYGYMNCSESDVQNGLLIPDGLVEGGDSDEDPCLSHYLAALKKYQTQYGLEDSDGQLNTQTVDEMMKSRCGDPDEPNTETELSESNEDLFSNHGSRRKRDTWIERGQSNISRMRRWVSSLLGYPDTDSPESVHWHLIPEGLSDSNKKKSLLQRVLHPRKQKKTSRRQEMLSEIKENIARNNITGNKTSRKKQRRRRETRWRLKRDQSYNQDFNLTEGKVNHRWNNKRVLKYKIAEKGFSAKIPLIDQCSTVALAFRMWAEVTNLDFRPLHPDQPVSDVDILFGFGTGKHWDCDVPFDGPGGMIGHSMININDNGYISFHMDDGEPFKAYPKDKNDGIPLLYTVIHEIGHVLGLPHMYIPGSVMYPTLAEEIYGIDFELTPRDRKAVQQLYGKCTGRFSAMFDWLHTDPTKQAGLGCMTPCTCDEQKWQYYSYIFREDMYWLYLNSERRPRYGDPLSIVLKWRDLPQQIDAVVQVTKELNGVCDGKTQFQLTTIFFSGERYYIYDDIEDKVRSENLISERFGPLPGQSTTVPSNLDAVVFDPRDNYLYFFKDQWVGVVDPFIENPENGSCCLQQYNFTEYFQFNVSEYQDINSTLEVPEINGYVDTVYLRYTERTFYFFKNEYVYMADIGPTSRKKVWGDPGPVQLHFMGKWNSKWYDLCDVHTTILDYCSVSNLYTSRHLT